MQTNANTGDDRKARALVALGQGKWVTEVAIAAGVARQTLYRWRQADPVFCAAWDRVQNVYYAERAARLMAARSARRAQRDAELLERRQQAAAHARANKRR